MEVLEARRAIANLRQITKVTENSDSSERATSADYQLIINCLEEMLVEVEAPRLDEQKLNALNAEVQRLIRSLTRRTADRLSALAASISAGRSTDQFLRSQPNYPAANAIIGDLCSRFVAAARRRTAEISAGIQPQPTIQVDSPLPTEDDAAMSTPTQSEIDLKIENMQLRMDGRLSSIEGKMDALAAQVSGSERAMALLAERAVAAAESAGNLKQTLWITSITTILAVLGIAFAAYFGTQASNIGIVGSTISAFEAGRSAGAPAAPSPPAPSTPAAK